MGPVPSITVRRGAVFAGVVAVADARGGVSERAERVELCPNVAASDECHVELKAKGDPALSVDAGAIHHVVLLRVGAALDVREIGEVSRHVGCGCGGRSRWSRRRHDTAGPGKADRRRPLAVPAQRASASKLAPRAGRRGASKAYNLSSLDCVLYVYIAVGPLALIHSSRNLAAGIR